MLPPRGRARAASAALCLTTLLALSACGDGNDDAQDPAPTGSEPSSSASTSPTDEPTDGSEGAAPTCAGVGADALERATGTAQQLLDPSGGGDSVRCGTGVDERGMRTEWEVRPLIGDLAVEGENAELPGLQRTRVQLPGPDGPVPAWQLTGTAAGNRVASVVTVLPGDRTVVVQAGDDGDSTASVTDAQLLQAALGVAEAIVTSDEERTS